MPALLHRVCPLCGQDDAAPFLQKHQLALVRCRNCAMTYANPVAGELAGPLYEQLGTPFYLAPEKLESDYASVRFTRELRLFQRFCPAGDVLDVGCSTGAFLFQLRSRGDYRVVGTDISAPALAYARSRGIEVVAGSFLEHDFGERRFDAVTFWAVLEHVLTPGDFLRRALGLLQPGGHVFLLVPNLRSLAVRLLGRKYRYILPQHVNYFTAATLGRLAQIAGLRVVARGTMHFNPAVIWQDARGRGGFVADDERAALLRRTTALKQNPLLQPARFVYRLTEQALGSLGLADNLFLVLRKT
jgi:2-polyprenyl-3-methyl-5-hydroxy-6-metoxy-1,4-benzoquinol methylase